MTKLRSGDVVVQESFLEVRAKLLEIAATLDRIDRAAGDRSLVDDARDKRALLDEAIAVLQGESPDRAERLQRLFSRGYDESWRQQFGL